MVLQFKLLVMNRREYSLSCTSALNPAYTQAPRNEATPVVILWIIQEYTVCLQFKATRVHYTRTFRRFRKIAKSDY